MSPDTPSQEEQDAMAAEWAAALAEAKPAEVAEEVQPAADQVKSPRAGRTALPGSRRR